MSKYSVEEVRMAVKLFAGYSATHHGIGGGLMDIALAFAERIEADEGAVAVDEYAAGWRQAARWAERTDLLADIGSPAYERDKAFVLQTPTAEPMAQDGDRDAFEGAREDLLDWKGRAQRAEATLRSLGHTGIDASEPRRGIRLGLSLANELANHLGPELHEYRDALRRAIAEAEAQ